jgi:hypothetical protein
MLARCATPTRSTRCARASGGCNTLFHVYPAGSREAVALAGDAVVRMLVVAPTGADGLFLAGTFSGVKVALPMPANSECRRLAHRITRARARRVARRCESRQPAAHGAVACADDGLLPRGVVRCKNTHRSARASAIRLTTIDALTHAQAGESDVSRCRYTTGWRQALVGGVKSRDVV